MTNEFYVRPVVRVADVERSVQYFEQKLGFSCEWGSEVIAQVSRGGLDVILSSGPLNPGQHSVLSMSLHTPDDLSALYQDLCDRGALVGPPPAEVHWDKGVYEFTVRDLDDNVLMFWGNGPG